MSTERYDQHSGPNKITSTHNTCIAQLAPTTAIRKNLDDRFLVIIMTPGLMAHEVETRLTYIVDGGRPVLLIASKGARRACGDAVVCAYHAFQQYVLLPEDVVLDSFRRESNEGLFVFSFQKRPMDVILGVQ